MPDTLTRGRAGRCLLLLAAAGSILVAGCSPGGEEAPPGYRLADRLVAASRLVGYLRFFHAGQAGPSAGPEPDWNNLAAGAIRIAERTGGAPSLARELEAYFRPVSPEIEIYPDPTTSATAGRSAFDQKGFVAHLGAGISCRLPRPRPVPSRSASPLPRPIRGGSGVPDRVPAAMPGPLFQSTPVRSSDGRHDPKYVHLAAVGMAWNYFQHFYPHRAQAAPDWDGALDWALAETLALHAANRSEADRERLFFRILRHLVARANDGQAAVTSPHDLDADYRPPLVCRLVEGHVLVTGPATGEVPIWPGEEIIRIEGVGPRLKMSYTADLISGSTERQVLYRAANESLSGPKDSAVTLRVMPHGKRPRYVTVRRTEDASHRARDVRPEPVAELAPGIWYIGVGRVGDRDVVQALPVLASARGLILDLREEPAGLSIRRTILPHLIGRPIASPPFEMPTFDLPDQASARFVRYSWQVSPQAPRIRARVAFLVDAGTSGEREILLAMARRHGLGEIVGEPSAGAPAGSPGRSAELGRVELPGGYRLTWTRVRTLDYDGKPSHGVGVEPTVSASLTREGLWHGRDDVLQRAIAVVSSPDRPRTGSPPGR